MERWKGRGIYTCKLLLYEIWVLRVKCRTSLVKKLVFVFFHFSFILYLSIHQSWSWRPWFSPHPTISLIIPSKTLIIIIVISSYSMILTNNTTTIITPLWISFKTPIFYLLQIGIVSKVAWYFAIKWICFEEDKMQLLPQQRSGLQSHEFWCSWSSALR